MRVEKYIRSMNDMKHFIMFKATLPFNFKLNNNDICFESTLKIDEELNNTKRKYRVIIKDSFVENQRVPSMNSDFEKMILKNYIIWYSYFITDIEIHIEIFDEEIDIIKKIYQNEKNIEKLSFIFQNAMRIFAYFYNCSKSGKEFFEPIASHYGPFVAVFYNMNEESDKHSSIIAPSYMLKSIDNGNKTEFDINNSEQWLYYFNKAKNQYNIFNNTEVILLCAMSIESYVMQSIRSNNLLEDFEIYKKEITSKNLCKKGFTFFDEVDFLNYKGVFDVNKQSKIKELFSSFNNYRNGIVHGDYEAPFFERRIATTCIKKLISYYSEYEKDNI